MQTKRGIAINNSLVHGICNYSCTLCSVNKSGWQGPRKWQPAEVTQALITRIREAALEGVHVRYVANAGDGEPTLHPELADRLALFADLVRDWPTRARHPAPEISLVTNGARLVTPGVLDALTQSGELTLIVSLPTVDPQDYGQVMMGRPELGERLLARVLEGLAAAMRLRSSGALRRLVIHVSPPDRAVVRRGFSRLVECLSRMAGLAGVEKLELTLFPATANRAGLLGVGQARLDMFRDLFRRYDGQQVAGVELSLSRVIDRFFAGGGEIFDLLKTTAFPCIWNANFFITPDGHSICCNDQHARDVQGTIVGRSLSELLALKQRMLPGPACQGCNQAPMHLKGSLSAALYRSAARARFAYARRVHT